MTLLSIERGARDTANGLVAVDTLNVGVRTMEVTDPLRNVTGDS